MEKYRSEAHDAATQCNVRSMDACSAHAGTLYLSLSFQYLRQEICDEILTDANQKYATPKLIKKLMCAFQDLEVRNRCVRQCFC